jgi:hypothetical protein
MNIKLNTVKNFLQNDSIQVSAEASARLAFFLNDIADHIARQALLNLEEENQARAIQGIPPRHRLTAQDIDRILNHDQSQ